MARRYFGTDGIRGLVGSDPMTADFALRLAFASARVLAPDGGSLLVGKDTRVSGYMFEAALEAGFVASGVDVLLTGPLPTPGIAYLTKQLGADFGIVISGSHNPYYDNGIKFFDREGEKLSDEIEESIEKIANAAKDHNKAWGRPVINKEDIKLLYSQGALLIPYGNDLSILKNELERISNEIDSIINE